MRTSSPALTSSWWREECIFTEKIRIGEKVRYLHDQVLTPPDELWLCVDDCLEEPQVLHMLPMALDTVDKMLNHLLVHFIAQNCIVLQCSTMSLHNGFNKTPERLHTWSLHAAGLDSGTAQGACEAAPGSCQDLEMVSRSFQTGPNLIVLVWKTEVLKELVSKPHQLVHPHVLLLVEGDLQQVQHHLNQLRCYPSKASWLLLALWTPMFLNSLCSCFRGFNVPPKPAYLITWGYFSKVFIFWIPEHTSCSSDRESAEWFCNSVIGSAQGEDLAIQSKRGSTFVSISNKLLDSLILKSSQEQSTRVIITSIWGEWLRWHTKFNQWVLFAQFGCEWTIAYMKEE